MRRFLNERHRRSPRATIFRIAALAFVALIVAFFPVPEGTYSFDGASLHGLSDSPALSGRLPQSLCDEAVLEVEIVESAQCGLHEYSLDTPQTITIGGLQPLAFP
jgi:hypothetical protein